MKRTLLVLALTPVLLGGCGLLLTKGPPAGHEQMTAFRCTESTTGPALDIVFGATNLIGSVAIAERREPYRSSNGEVISDGTFIASGVLWAVISGVSASVGFGRVKRCVTAKRQLAERQARGPGGAAASAGVQRVLIQSHEDTLSVGEQKQLAAKAFDSNGAVVLGTTFRWSSSNDAIASVSNDGLVTTRAAGTAVIAANFDNVVGTVRVVVVSQR